MKYLCVCDRGNVRSYALSLVLKRMNHEAIAIGRFTMKPETIKMLCEWADAVVLMEPHMRESIPELYHPKTWVIDVGPDRWGAQIDPELKDLVEEGAAFLGR